MIFSSNTFLLYFFPAFIISYYLVRPAYKNAVILIFSIIFYTWGAGGYIFVILATTFVDFHLVKWMDASASQQRRKQLLILSICMNLGLLFYFKYSFFFIQNLNSAFGTIGLKPIFWIKPWLPLGISFYTFESLTYMIDVYRREHKPLQRFYDYQLYITLFPKLIAGPIVRYIDIADQIEDRTAYETSDNRLDGFYRFTIGLFKKLMIADVLGTYIDNLFNMYAPSVHPIACWIALIGFSFQIYFDFSGYSDMAIGLGKMIGFRLTENFNNPFNATSVSDLWRRWHITLGNWMRYYLYIPLGGNRAGTLRTYINLMIVFFAVGLWHGPSWSFFIWGGIQGVFIILERIFLQKILDRLGRLLSLAYTFLVFTLSLIFWRSSNPADCLLFLKQMFTFHNVGNLVRPDMHFWLAFALGAFFSFFAVPSLGRKIQQYVFEEQHPLKAHYLFTIASLLFIIISVITVTTYHTNAFIYFQF